jgi:hypothetical protein
MKDLCDETWDKLYGSVLGFLDSNSCYTIVGELTEDNYE